MYNIDTCYINIIFISMYSLWNIGCLEYLSVLTFSLVFTYTVLILVCNIFQEKNTAVYILFCTSLWLLKQSYLYTAAKEVFCKHNFPITWNCFCFILGNLSLLWINLLPPSPTPPGTPVFVAHWIVWLIE